MLLEKLFFKVDHYSKMAYNCATGGANVDRCNRLVYNRAAGGATVDRDRKLVYNCATATGYGI